MAARRRRPRRNSTERLAVDAALRLGRTPGGLKVLLFLAVLGVLAYGANRLYQLRPDLTSSPEPAPTTNAAAGPVRIATWNLRKFSDRANPDLVAIAKIIERNDFHLLAIQEVQQEGQTVQRLRRQLGEPWRHAVSGRTGNNERFAFLYRSDRVEMLSEPAMMTGPLAPTFDRVPYIGAFRAGAFDFTLLTVHFSYTDTARRRREAEALARFAEDMAAHSAEKDVIALGDFNEQGKGNLHYFESNGWVKLNHEATNLGSVEYVYDNILIDPDFTREFAGRVGVVRFDAAFAGDAKRAADEISDHRPVYADFATGTDDD